MSGAAVSSIGDGIDANDWMPDQVVQREELDLKPESGEVARSRVPQASRPPTNGAALAAAPHSSSVQVHSIA